ncbi:MAG: ASCH domain-containing protein [Treponema sp.]|nr:ASCH domain-containing protein [Treponema sp.]
MTAEEMWKKSGLEGSYYAWSFGVEADELAKLVICGKKTATASAYRLYEIDGEPLPQVGDYSVILDSRDEAVCIIRDTKTSVVRFCDVSAEHAAKEGEGDLSLEFWRQVHRDFFEPQFKDEGLEFSEDMEVYCEEFELVYPRTFTEKELWVKRGDKDIYCLFYIPSADEWGTEAAGRRFPLIILGHGYQGCYRNNLNCAERYAAQGFAVCSFDFCGGTDHARSSGPTDEMSIITERDDMIAVFEAAQKLEFVDSCNIILWGESMGGYVAALAGAELAGRAEAPAALVLFYPAFNIRDEALADHKTKENIQPRVRRGIRLGKCFAEDIWDTDPYSVIGKYNGPVLILHGTADDVVPPEYSVRAKKVYDEARPQGTAELIWIDGAGHGFFGRTGAHADSLVTGWLKR